MSKDRPKIAHTPNIRIGEP
uniref:Uncharacterized protein n=1 Tax=Rhizophora mucronata TaxID=61149 RepID=A0A2P2MWN4_RHIMU